MNNINIFLNSKESSLRLNTEGITKEDIPEILDHLYSLRNEEPVIIQPSLWCKKLFDTIDVNDLTLDDVTTKVMIDNIIGAISDTYEISGVGFCEETLRSDLTKIFGQSTIRLLQMVIDIGAETQLSVELSRIFWKKFSGLTITNRAKIQKTINILKRLQRKM